MPSDEETRTTTEESNDDDVSDEADAPAVEYSETDPESAGESAASEPDAEDAEDAEDTEDAEETESDSVADVETILVDPDDIVRSVAYNGQEDIGHEGKAVFSLSPPFGETVEPTIRHLDDDSRETKADDEIHIRPFRFVVEGRKVIEQRPTRELAKSKLDDEDPSEAAIEAWIDEAMETWSSHVRENLVGSVDIYSPGGMAFVDVEYREEEEE